MNISKPIAIAILLLLFLLVSLVIAESIFDLSLL